MNIEKENKDLFNDDFFKPDDRIWDGIVDHLPERKRRGFGLLIFTSTILFITTIYFYNKSQKLLNAPIKTQVLNTANFEVPFLEKDIYNIEQTKSHESKNRQSTDKPIDLISKENNTNFLNKPVSKFNNNILLANDYKFNISSLVNLQDTADTSNFVPDLLNNNSKEVFDNKINFSTSNTKMFLLDRLRLMNLEIPRKMLGIDLILENKKPNDKKHSIEATLGKEFYINQPKTNSNNPLSELVSQSYLKNQFIAGLGISKNMQNNIFSLGFEYGKYSYNVHYDINLPYDLSIEENHGDISTNHLNHNLPNAISSIETDLVLQRSTDSPVEHNENVYLTLDTKLTYDIYRLRISYQRKIGDFYGGISILPGYKANVIEEDKLLSHHTYVQTNSFVTKASFIEQYSFDLSLDAVYMKNIGNENYLGLKASIRTDLLDDTHAFRVNPSLHYQKHF